MRFVSVSLAVVVAFGCLGVGAAMSDPPANTAVLANPQVAEPPDGAEDGPFQVMCVRACDGFYFPVRQNARRGNFMHDALSCAASCGSDARIFYFKSESGNPRSMIDVSGRRYVDEPHAFLYRRSRVPACTCKPNPWTKQALEKHRAYSQAEAASRAKWNRIERLRVRAAAVRASAALSNAAADAYYRN